MKDQVTWTRLVVRAWEIALKVEGKVPDHRGDNGL